MTPTGKPVPELLAATGDRLDQTPLAVLLDVDGTLAPIAPTPSEARVPEATRQVVARLAQAPGVTVALVSGRAADDAWRVAGVPGAWVIGNHGFEVRDPHGVISPDVRVRDYGHAIAVAAQVLATDLRAVPGAIVENKRWTLSLHYRLVDATEVPNLLARAAAVARELGLRVMEGKKIVELRPPVDVDKGTASITLVRRLGVSGVVGCAMYCGDDRTDEDAFRELRVALPSALTVRIASGEDAADLETNAEFVLGSLDELRQVLEALSARRAGSSESRQRLSRGASR